MTVEEKQDIVTAEGNPRHPEGEAGAQMLARMNESHAAVTEWALGFFQLQPDDDVLDIGCGAGRRSRAWQDACPRGI